MKDVNKMILIGRLGADPSQKEIPNGTLVTHFPLATSRKIRKDAKISDEGVEPTEGSTLVEETTWHKVFVWGKQGEVCAQYLKKGQTVYVEGMLRVRNYKAQQDGQYRTAVEIHAENVVFLSAPRVRAVAPEVAEVVEGA